MPDGETHKRAYSFPASDDFSAKDIAEAYAPNIGKEFLGKPNVRLAKLERLIQEEKRATVPLKV